MSAFGQISSSHFPSLHDPFPHRESGGCGHSSSDVHFDGMSSSLHSVIGRQSHSDNRQSASPSGQQRTSVAFAHRTHSLVVNGGPHVPLVIQVSLYASPEQDPETSTQPSQSTAAKKDRAATMDLLQDSAHN